MEGTATITATDTTIPINFASSLVIVSYPFKVVQPEQYIALGDDPVFDPKIFDKDGKPFDIFERVIWEAIGDWSTIGRKEVTLKYHDYSFVAIVHVCPPIELSPSEAILPISYSGFDVIAHGGSGEYSFSIDNSNIITYQNGKVSTFAIGTAKITATDRLISKYTAIATIIVAKVESTEINLTHRELLIDQVFQPTCDVYAPGHQQFSVPVPYRFASVKTGIVSSVLRANSPGFSHIYCESGGVQSAKILVSAADKLRVEVNGRTSPNSNTPLTISGGVLRWPNGDAPDIKIECPNAKIDKYITDTSFLIDVPYSQTCHAEMSNKASPSNPNPITVSSDFHLDSSYVDHFIMNVVDENAIPFKECNLPSKRFDKSEAPRLNYNVIPKHLLKVFVYPVDKDGNMINFYSAYPVQLQAANNLIRALDNHGVKGETIFHYTPSSDIDLSLMSSDFQTNVTNLRIIPPFIVENSKVVYHKQGSSYTFHIDGGSGLFNTTSIDAKIEQGALVVTPARPGISNYVIKDRCSNQNQDIQLNAISVVSIQVIAPAYVPVNAEFFAQIRAYSKNNVLIPDELIEQAGITLTPSYSKQVGLNNWSITPAQVGELNLEATASNGIKGNAIVDVIESIVVSPQHIVLLPGESETIEIVRGPNNLVFDCGDERIAKMNGLQVIGMQPGKLVINVTARDYSTIDPFQVFVHVLTPKALRIIPSTKYVIQGGYLALNLVVETELGDRIPKKANWIMNDPKFQWIKLNESSVFINCSEYGELSVQVEAYRVLKATYSTIVEQKLIILSANPVILPPSGSDQIIALNDIHCQYEIINQEGSPISSVTSEGLIKANTTGEALIIVRYEHQQLVLTVRVSNPSLLYINQMPPTDYQLMLLDPYGLQFTSLNGVSFELTGPNDFNHTGIDTTGYCKSDFMGSKKFPLHAVAHNQHFKLETTKEVHVSITIIPDTAILQKGTNLQFKCTSPRPQWYTNDTAIALIDTDGIVHARRAGNAQISCGQTTADVHVVEIKELQIINNVKDEYEIVTRYIRPNTKADEVIAPVDMTYRCEWEQNDCGTVNLVQNSTGNFCILQRFSQRSCPPRTNLYAYVESQQTKLSLKTGFVVAYYGTVDFGVPNQMRVAVSATNRKVVIPVKTKSNDLKIEKPQGLIVSFPPEGGLIIRAEESFKTKGLVSLEHKATGEKVQIEVVHESASQDESPIIHSRDSSFAQSLIFYFCVVMLFFCVFIFIVFVTNQQS